MTSSLFYLSEPGFGEIYEMGGIFMINEINTIIQVINGESPPVFTVRAFCINQSTLLFAVTTW